VVARKGFLSIFEDSELEIIVICEFVCSLQIAVAVARIYKAVTDTQLGQYDPEGPKRDYQKLMAGGSVPVPKVKSGVKTAKKGGKKAPAPDTATGQAADATTKQSNKKRKSTELQGLAPGDAKVAFLADFVVSFFFFLFPFFPFFLFLFPLYKVPLPFG